VAGEKVEEVEAVAWLARKKKQACQCEDSNQDSLEVDFGGWQEA
jgi:hypothetical protein